MQPGLHAQQDPPRRWAAPVIGRPGGASADLLADPLAAPLAGDLVAGLMRRHEVAAERLIGWLRVGIGVCVFVTVIAASHVLHELAGVSLGVFQHNAWIAALGFLIAGAASIVLAVPQRWHHGYAYLFMVLDVGLVLAIAVLALGERDLPGNALPSAPIIWAIPLVLAVGALRYDVKVQLCAVALLALEGQAAEDNQKAVSAKTAALDELLRSALPELVALREAGHLQASAVEALTQAAATWHEIRQAVAEQMRRPLPGRDKIGRAHV